MKIGIVASHRNEKSTALQEMITKSYPEIALIDGIPGIADKDREDYDIIIGLGGDGFILRILHKLISEGKNSKVYGINCGNLGFLLNSFNILKDNLIEKITSATLVQLSPLKVIMEDRSGKLHIIHAINEISLIRQTYQAVNIKVIIDDEVKISNLIGDGVLLATSTGSAAYNLSAGGVILPIESNLTTVTAINPFRPKGWHYAILKQHSVVEFEVLDSVKRPVLACADFNQFYFIQSVKSYIDPAIKYSLLFNKENHLSDKIMDEQFVI